MFIENRRRIFENIPDQFKTQKLWKRVVEDDVFEDVPYQIVTQKMWTDAIFEAASNGHIEAVKQWKGWLGFREIYDELFRYHHKRQFAQKIHDELLPITWYPDRVWDWCFDEEEKQVAGQLWN